MKGSITYHWFVVALYFCSLPIHAQDKEVDMSELRLSLERDAARQTGVLSNPADLVNDIGFGSAASVEFSKDKKNITASYNIGTAGNNIWSFSVKAPWDSVTGNSNIANQDGISAKETVGVSYRWIDLKLDENSIPALSNNSAVCENVGLLIRTSRKEKETDIVKMQQNAVSASSVLFTLENQRLSQLKVLEGVISNDCNVGGIAAFIKKDKDNPTRAIPEDVASAIEKEIVGISKVRNALKSPIPFYSLDFSYSKPKLEYKESINAAESTSRTIDNYTLSASAGWHLTDSNALVRGILQRKKAFGKTQSQNICSPNTEFPGYFQCADAIIGTPTVEKAESIGIEYRKDFGDVVLGATAMRTFGEKRKDTVSVPLWLKQIAGTENIRPGIRIDWDDSLDENKTSITFFIGVYNLP